MSRIQVLLNILLVALVIGGALATVFVQLISFEVASGNGQAVRIWLLEWVGFDVLLTGFLCRQEIRSLFRPSSPR